MKYSAKQMMTFLNISRETLRYYEQVGLIHPTIDEYNHYRYYHDNDVEMIAIFRKYRSQALSIKEIQQLNSLESIEDYKHFFINKEEDYQKQINYYLLLQKKNSELIKMIEEYQNNPTILKQEESPHYWLYPAYLDEHFENRKNMYDNFKNTSFEDLAFIDFAIVYNQQLIGGTAYEDEWKTLLDLKSEALKEIPSYKAESFYFETDDYLNIHFEDYIFALQIMKIGNKRIFKCYRKLGE